MDTHRKLKQHKTFAWRPTLDVNVLYTFNLRCALTRLCHFAEYLRYSVPLKVCSKPSQICGEEVSPKIINGLQRFVRLFSQYVPSYVLLSL